MKIKLLALLFCVLNTVLYGKEITVEVSNPTDLQRLHETVEIPWPKVLSHLPDITPQTLVVLSPNGKAIPAQVITQGEQAPQSVIFQLTLDGKSTAHYRIKKGDPVTPSPQVYGRLVPERMDDFAWENNQIGFRMYGPALEATGEVSNGIDIWQKRTEALVVDKWYKNGDYHTDHGEGLDGYKVGRTLGAGAMAPYLNDSLWLGKNFTSARILDDGPIRITFELTYAPYTVGNGSVIERRIISLDANTRFNRITELYDRTMPVAAGIVLRTNGEQLQDPTCIAYWEPESGKDGHTGVGVIFPQGITRSIDTQGHLLALSSVKANKPFTYYAGAGWSKAGTPNAAAWFTLVKEESSKRTHPLKIKIR